MKLGVPQLNKNTSRNRQNHTQVQKKHSLETKFPKNKKENKNKMSGQSYVWRVVVIKRFRVNPELTKTFTKKVDALNYLNEVISLGYKKSKIVKWEGQ
jgi:hypothetical protein